MATLMACGSSTTTVEGESPGAGGNGGSGAAGGAGGGLGAVGDPCTLDSCGEGLFCDFEDDRCGTNGATGTCMAASNGASTESPSTICGCDGNVYEFWFEHQQAGYDTGALDLCPPPAGSFWCGEETCSDDGMTYCAQGGLCSGEPTRCEMLPAACVGSQDCSCFGPMVTGCELREDGIFEVGCN